MMLEAARDKIAYPLKVIRKPITEEQYAELMLASARGAGQKCRTPTKASNQIKPLPESEIAAQKTILLDLMKSLPRPMGLRRIAEQTDFSETQVRDRLNGLISESKVAVRTKRNVYEVVR